MRPSQSGNDAYLPSTILLEIDPTIGLWGLFVSAFISSTVAPGGSEAVLAFLVTAGKTPHGWLLLAASVGNTLGALTTWFLGTLVSRGYPVEKLAGKQNQRAVQAVRKWGVPVLFFSWLPVIGDALCLAGGWLKLPLFKSVIVIAFGKTARYGAVIYAFL